jgi:hypothetical protein
MKARAAARFTKRFGILLLNDAAGDAIARVSGRVTHQVIGFRVNDERRAAVMEKRIGAVAERDAFIEEADAALAVRGDCEVRQIAGVRVRVHCIVRAMVSTGWIKVAAGRLEIGAFALANRMDVDAVIACSEPSNLCRDLDAAADSFEFGGANLCALRIHDICVRGFRGRIGQSGCRAN